MKVGDMVSWKVSDLESRPPEKQSGIVVGFDMKDGAGWIHVKWSGDYGTFWSMFWQLEVISENR
jgi:hypothetical protein